MTLSAPLPPGQTPTTPGLDDFRRCAALGEAVQLHVDGESFKLIATGQTPSGRAVAWVDGADTTSLFVSALENAVGGTLSQAVAQELGLQAAPGKSLSSRTVEQALNMLETASMALEGVRFSAGLEKPAGKTAG